MSIQQGHLVLRIQLKVILLACLVGLCWLGLQKLGLASGPESPIAAVRTYTCADPDGWCEAYNADGTAMYSAWGLYRAGMLYGMPAQLTPSRGMLKFSSFVHTAYYETTDWK